MGKIFIIEMIFKVIALLFIGHQLRLASKEKQKGNVLNAICELMYVLMVLVMFVR